VNLKSGWTLLKRDPITGRTIIKSHPGEPELVEPEKNEQKIGRDILKALVNLHEKRTNEYIDTYGYHVWEKMFKRPRWREEELENMSDSDEDYEDEDYEDQDYEDQEDYY